MPNTDEILLRLEIAQLEGRMAIYEGMIKEIAKLESVQQTVSEIKVKLENVATVWGERKPR